jgi:hypothetical protein
MKIDGARESADVDELHRCLLSIDTRITRAPRKDDWTPGDYSLLFDA